jgi:hypothetical protein
MYVSQLLPDLEEAKLLRKLLGDFIAAELGSELEIDMAHKMFAKLCTDIRNSAKVR